MKKCSAQLAIEDTTTRKLYMRMNMKKENDSPSSVYENVPATVKINFKSMTCVTNALASSLPTTTRTYTVRLENRSGLGACSSSQ